MFFLAVLVMNRVSTILVINRDDLCTRLEMRIYSFKRS